MSKEIALTDKEEAFIEHLLDNGGNVKQAYVAAGYDPKYAHTAAYTVRKRLAKEIAEATQHYIAYHAPKAAHRVIAMMDEDMPNPTHLSAAKDILDRAGAKVKEEIQQVSVVKANIFILPEKKLIEEAKIIDVE